MPDDYLPPCFWSANAFSPTELQVRHDHPFSNLKVQAIKERLPPFSVFTWPFRLSFNHGKIKKMQEGQYPHPAELDRRIDQFRLKFKPMMSLVFFYLNYDNPISAEENEYVLVGCGLLKNEIAMPSEYDFDPEELSRLRSKHENKNFPTLNWALLVSVDPSNLIILPYKEYLSRIQEQSESEEARSKLEEMRVIIDEEALIPSFKYVANELDFDGAIYLLYKLRKSLTIVREHGFVNVSKELKLVDEFLKNVWCRRGLYPSLSTILDLIGGFEAQEHIGSQIVAAVQQNIQPNQDLLNTTLQILTSDSAVPSYLEHLTAYLDELRSNIGDWNVRLEILRKLSLFTLTSTQIKRISLNEKNTFKRHIDSDEIVNNPYVLAEEYRHIWNEDYLDMPEIPDQPIGVTKIDIGMFPDFKYLRRNTELQNLTPASPERLRALIIDFLYGIGRKGDCYATSNAIYAHVSTHPIFYKSELNVSQAELEAPEGRYCEHFDARLKTIRKNGHVFFYLNEVVLAEELVRKTIDELLKNRVDYRIAIANLRKFLRQECRKVRESVGKPFDRGEQRLFLKEREKLLRDVLAKSVYIITGIPGSGKTKILGKIVSELHTRGEQVTVLALTGKATLRLKNVFKEQGLPVEPQTIDRFLYGIGCGKYLDDFSRLAELSQEQGVDIENLIIDECSMVDLQRLAVLFVLLKRTEAEEKKLKIRRVILVGDENQLPPIGFGKPFFDIIQYIKENKMLRESHHTELCSNCRQGFDKKILEIAMLFRGKNRYYEELIDRLGRGGRISPGLEVLIWKEGKDLHDRIEKKINNLLKDGLSKRQLAENKDSGSRLRVLFGLYGNGHVPKNSPQGMKLDELQVLTPYRGGGYGTIGINACLKDTYKVPNPWDVWFRQSTFNHSDKIIRINNWYDYDPKRQGRTLVLSNGSIGLVCNKAKLGMRRRYFFSDQENYFDGIDDEENFELAYAITVHKSQGNDFSHVFLVVPLRLGLLNKELMYTAFTRSRGRLTLFLQRRGELNPLSLARTRSAILERNTSIFAEPEDHKAKYWPAPGIHVRSKIEYIIYRALQEAQRSGRIDFAYEAKRDLAGQLTIHPDFTIRVGKRRYYWEHLGELDIKYYSKNWQERKRLYEENDLIDSLVTTDDLDGVREDFLSQVIQDLAKGKLRATPKSKFSRHHYPLY